MAVSPRLSRKFQQTLGEEAAEDLVHWMDQVDAQAEDVRTLIARVTEWRDAARAEMRAEIGSLRSEIRSEVDSLRSEVRSEVGSLRSEVRSEVGSLRSAMSAESASLRGEITALRSEMRAEIARSHADLIKWSFVFWATTLGAVVFTR